MEWVEPYRVIYGIVSLLLSRAGCRPDRQRGGSGLARRARSAGGNWCSRMARQRRRSEVVIATAKIEDHAAFILKAIEQQPDPTLAELREMLATRGASVSIATLWRFFARHGITRKKRPATRASRTAPTS